MATDQHGAPDQHNLPGQQRRILGVDIDALTLDQTVQRCLAAIDSGEPATLDAAMDPIQS